MNAWLQWLDAAALDWAMILWRASWQGAVAIALGCAIIRFTRLAAPRVQCWIWRLVCLKLLVALVWLTPIGLPLLPAKAPLASPQVPPPRTATQRPAWETIAADPLPAKPTAATNAIADAPSPSIGILGIVMLLWIAGVAYQAYRTMREWMTAARLRRAARPVDDRELQRLLSDEAQRIGVKRLPELRLSSDGTSPLLTGIWRPAIVLPESIARGFDAADLRLMLAHELAHVQRRDLLWNWLPTVVGWLYFFHPLAWLLRRSWSAAQEAACDELVLQRRCGQPAEYGRMLVKLAAGCPGETPTTLAAAGVLGGYRRLEQRIECLSRVTAPSMRRLAAAATAIALLAAVGIVPWRLVAQELPPNTFQVTQAPGQEANQPLPPNTFQAAQPITGAFVPAKPAAPKPPSEAHQKAVAKLIEFGASVYSGTDGGWTVAVGAQGRWSGFAPADWSGGDEGLELLAQLDAIELLVVRCEKISEKGLSIIKKLKPIASLLLFQPSDVQLSVLEGERSIANLSLMDARLTDAGLKTVGTLTNLQSLGVSGKFSQDGGESQLTDAGIAELAACSKLRSLSIGSTPDVTGSTLGQLSALPELEKLSLSQIELDDRGAAEVAKLRQLKELNINTKHVTSAGYAPLADMDRLEHLMLAHSVHFDDAAANCLAGMMNLRKLAITWGGLTDAGLANLAGLQRLQELNIWTAQFGDAGMAHLKNLKELRVLKISGENVDYTDEGLKRLAGLTQLEKFVIPSKELTDDALNVFANLKELQVIDLSGTQVRGPGLDALAGLPKLTVLDLGRTPITDAELGRLARLPALKALSLDDSAVTDAGAKALARLPRLRLLNMINDRITDAGLDALAELKTLRQLTVTGNKVTKEGIERLLTRLPDLRVNVGAWRRGFDGDIDSISFSGGDNSFNIETVAVDLAELDAEPDDAPPDVNKSGDEATVTLNIQPITGSAQPVTGTFRPQQRVAPKPPSETHQQASAELKKLGAEVVPGTKGGWVVAVLDLWTGADQGLELLAKLDEIEVLVLNCEKLSDQGLAVLKKLKPVAVVQLIQPNDQQFEALRGNESISNLTLLGRRMTDAGLKSVATLINLESIHLSDWSEPGAVESQITEAGIAELAACKKLRRLSIDTVPGSTVSKLGQLAELPDLESLWLLNIGLDGGGLAEAAKLRRLKTLIVSGKQISSAGYAPLARLDRLEHLSINEAANFDDAAAACLEGMKNLNRLDLFESRITDAGLAHVAGLERLQQINFWQGEIGDAGLAHLKDLKDLRILNLSGDNVRITGEGLKHLSGLTQLENFVIPSKELTDDALEALSALQGLRSIDLSGSKVRGPGLDALAGLPKLKVLDLGRTAIADAELGRLAKFPALEALTLDDTAVTDQGLKTVAQLPHLKLLNLRNNEITDAGLEALAPLKTLRQLRIRSDKVSKEGIKRLQAKLPKLRIDNTDLLGLSFDYTFELDEDSAMQQLDE